MYSLSQTVVVISRWHFIDLSLFPEMCMRKYTYFVCAFKLPV